MKKKIAVFAAGWGSEILDQLMKGIYRGFEDVDADIYLFLGFPLLTDELTSIDGEINIFSLPHLEDFDGAIIFGNSIDFGDSFEKINRSCSEAKVPTVSCGRVPKYGHFISPNNKDGMKKLCDHLINDHGVNSVIYFAGSQNNPDSNTRWEVIKESFSGTRFANIVYTDWNLGVPAQYVHDLVAEGGKLPDAFMCANDGLAIFAATALQEHDFVIPRDVIVTGFDDTYSSSIFDPSLTSVSQDFENIGLVAADVIKKIINNEEVSKNIELPCILKNRESCGCCENSEETEKARRTIGKQIFVDRLISNNFVSKLNYLDAKLLSGMEFNDIYTSLAEFYASNSGFEKGNMHILLEPDYENSVYDENIKLRQSGYSDYMFDIFSMNDGVISFDPHFETRKLVPNLEKEIPGNHIYIFSPLHDGDRAMGYYVFRDIVEEVDKNNNLVRYEQRLNSIFIKYKKNLLANYLNNMLKIINETDPLTGVKNRTAYDLKIADMNSRIFGKTMDPFALVVFDINDLKKINDEFGHERGDEYICSSCKLLCDVFKHSPVFRIGGDEFITILSGDDHKNGDELLLKLEEEMKILGSTENDIWKRVSIAFGMSGFDPKHDKTVSDVFKRADTVMYENKRESKNKK
ncbi:MAG: diguanylate cyclase [Lachnospiraceae bacterium]|nr:diguanylate cyclase [Lachnospiraceae bacterium]